MSLSRRLNFLLLTAAAAICAATGPDGSEVYARHCATCHATPAARVPSLESMRGMSARRIVNSLESGTMFMPGRRLTPEQRRAVAEYLTGKPFRIESRSIRGLCRENTAWKYTRSGWNGWSPDLSNTRFQPSGGLSASDLPRLRLKWAFGFEDEVMAFAQPSIAGGRVFVGSAGGTMYSLDAKSGCVYWSFEAEAAVRAAALVDQNTVWFGGLHANIYAVNAATGKLRWKRHLDPHSSARVTGAPALHAGRLYVPLSSFEEGMASHPGYACCTFRGSVVALDARTGKQIWQRFTVDTPATVMGKSRAGVERWGPSGAAVWATPTVDARRGLLYIATGDNYGDPSTPLSDAVFAVRLNDGTLVWSNQLTHDDRWNAACLGDKVNCPDNAGPDHDFGTSVALVKTSSGRDLLIAAQKSGVVYALDLDGRGHVVWRTAVGKGGPLGGIMWGHAVDTRRVYAPISDVLLTNMSETGGGLAALDLEDGHPVWKADPPVCSGRSPCSPAQMAAATAIPDAVLSGARDGIMRAYSSEDGHILWSYDTFRDFETVNEVKARGGSLDGPGPVIADGMLYFNSGYALWNGRGGNVLLAFEPTP